MSEKERLQLENELLMTCSKAQAINKYINELEESAKLSKLWCKSQQENKQLKDNWNKLKEWAKYERKVAVGIQNGYGTSLCDCMMNKMRELEKGKSE